MELWQTITVSVVSAALGAGGVTPILIAWMNNRRQMKLDADQFAAKTWEQVLNRISSLEASERECMEAKEKLSVEVADLRAEVGKLRHVVASFETRHIVGHVECGTSGIITSFSEGMEDITGFTSSTMVGKNIEALMPPFSRVAHRAAFLEACKPTHVTRSLQLRDSFMATASGSTIPVTIILNSWVDTEGKKWFDAEVHRRDISPTREIK